MVEYILSLDNFFGSLADPTRRDILHRVAGTELTVSEIARPYDVSHAAVSKRLKILEQAKLIIKRHHGRQHLVQASPQALSAAAQHLKYIEQLWEDRFDRLEAYLNKEQPHA